MLFNISPPCRSVVSGAVGECGECGECRRVSACVGGGRVWSARGAAGECARPHAARVAIDRLPDARGPSCTHPALKPDSICGYVRFIAFSGDDRISFAIKSLRIFCYSLPLLTSLNNATLLFRSRRFSRICLSRGVFLVSSRRKTGDVYVCMYVCT